MPKQSRIHSFLPRTYGDLKAAVAALIHGAGGETRAADHCRVGKSMLSDYANPNRDSVHMPIDVVLQLERAIGHRAVTEHLAAAHDCILVQLPTRPASDIAWYRRLARMGKEAGDVFEKAENLLADKGDIDGESAPHLLQEVDELLAVVAELRAAVRGRLTDGA